VLYCLRVLSCAKETAVFRFRYSAALFDIFWLFLAVHCTEAKNSVSISMPHWGSSDPKTSKPNLEGYNRQEIKNFSKKQKCNRNDEINLKLLYTRIHPLIEIIFYCIPIFWLFMIKKILIYLSCFSYIKLRFSYKINFFFFNIRYRCICS